MYEVSATKPRLHDTPVLKSVSRLINLTSFRIVSFFVTRSRPTKSFYAFDYRCHYASYFYNFEHCARILTHPLLMICLTA